MKGHTKKPALKQKKKEAGILMPSRELERSIADRDKVMMEHMMRYPVSGLYTDIDEQNQSLLEYHEALQYIEQAVLESIRFFENTQPIENEGRQEQVQAWKAYLSSVHESCRQLVKSIEASTQLVFPENR